MTSSAIIAAPRPTGPTQSGDRTERAPRPRTVLIVFDTHTPYLAFRVRELWKAMCARGLDRLLRLEVVLLALDEPTYQWNDAGLSDLYGGVPVRALTDRFRGLGFSTYFRWTTIKSCLRIATILLRMRPCITFVGGYDRPESIEIALLSYLIGNKVGPLHDSRFNDVESYRKSVWLEWVKGFVLRQFDFFMCSGRECVEYSQFLAGSAKPAYQAAWDMVDNETIGRLAERSELDAKILAHFRLEPNTRFFLMPIRFIAKKNARMVIDAYDEYRRRIEREGRTPAKLIICGKGSLEAEYREQIERLGLKSLVGMSPWLSNQDMPRACRLSQCLILASTHDQWGMTINEALAAGAPVLCSNRAGAHELVQNYVNGFTFDPWQPQHLAELMAAMGNDQTLVERMRGRAAESVKGFSIDQWNAACFAVFRRFAGVDVAEIAPHVEDAADTKFHGDREASDQTAEAAPAHAVAAR